MSEYQHILVAVDANDDGRRLLIRASALAQRFRARLSVLHVVEYMPMDIGNELAVPSIDVSSELVEQTRTQLQVWCSELGIDPAALHVGVDDVRAGIVGHAERYGIDLIIVGHHRHKGLSSLFSHTEEGVLSRANCDVLAVAVDHH